MSFATLERAVLAELKQVAKNSKLRLKNIMEWSTGEVKAQEGETLYFLPDLKVWCAVNPSCVCGHFDSEHDREDVCGLCGCDNYKGNVSSKDDKIERKISCLKKSTVRL